MDENLESTARGIFERAKSIILTPKEEWPKIEAEAKPQGAILTGYVLPLVAIGPIATLIGGQLFGYGAFGFSYRPPLIGSIITALVSIALAVAMVYVLAFIVDWLAPKFDGQSNKANAFKLVTYGGTAAWLAGIFSLIPMLGVFALLGLYSLYLYYTGAAPLMKVPQDKSAGYVAVVIVCAILAALLIAPITAALTGILGYSALSGAGSLSAASSSGAAAGTVSLPGGGSVDIGKIEQMGKQAEAIANGNAKPVDIAKMQGLLPASIGAYQRTATESAGMGSIGGNAAGTYTSGDNSFKLSIIDMSTLGAIAGVGAAMGVTQSREDANGYERTGTVDGQMRSESWNKAENRGKFGVVIANRFIVEADGEAANIDELKAAVTSIDPGSLTGLVN